MTNFDPNKIKRVLAVDPSLTCSGWALLNCNSSNDNSIIAVGQIKSLSPSFSLSDRLLDLQHRILSLFEKLKLGSSDAVICESPTTVIDPSAAFKVEQVRCIYEVLARSLEIWVPGRINPRSIHRELLGMKGAQLKRSFVKQSAVTTVKMLFGSQLSAIGFPVNESDLAKKQDIVDALLLGSYATTKLQESKISGVELPQLLEKG